MAKNSNEEAIIFNIITIGDSNVGKTSIINRYIDNRFIENTLVPMIDKMKINWIDTKVINWTIMDVYKCNIFSQKI